MKDLRDLMEFRAQLFLPLRVYRMGAQWMYKGPMSAGPKEVRQRGARLYGATVNDPGWEGPISTQFAAALLRKLRAAPVSLSLEEVPL